MSVLYWKSASVGSLLRTVITERLFFIAISCSLLRSPSLSLNHNDTGFWTGPAAPKFCVTRHLLSPQSRPVYCRPVRSVRQTSLRSQRSLGHTHARTHTEGLTVTVKNRVLKFSGSHLLRSEECFIHERRWGYEGRPGVSGGFTRPPWQTSSLNNDTTCERCMSSKYLKK